MLQRRTLRYQDWPAPPPPKPVSSVGDMSFSGAGAPVSRRAPAASAVSGNIADHYDALARESSSSSSGCVEKRKRRSASLAIGVRNFNNSVKRALLAHWTPPPRPGTRHSLVDLGCGRGGDLDKWRRTLQGAGARVLGIDVSVDSVAEASRRAVSAQPQRKRTGNETHQPMVACTFYRADFADPLLWSWIDGRERNAFGARAATPWRDVDVVTCHFAMHYAWHSDRAALALLSNAAARLRCDGGRFICTVVSERVLRERWRRAGGGTIGNALYKIVRTQEGDGEGACESYAFSLVDAVNNCVEWVVPEAQLLRLAGEAGLTPVLQAQPFLDICPGPAVAAMSASEREVCSLYVAWVFERRET